MSVSPSQTQILAFAVFELRLLLAGHLGDRQECEPSVQVAAHLAYALHNQALAALEGRPFDTAEALEAIAKIDDAFSENLVQQLTEAVNRAI